MTELIVTKATTTIKRTKHTIAFTLRRTKPTNAVTRTTTIQNAPTRLEKRKKKIKYRDKMKFITAITTIGLIMALGLRLEMNDGSGGVGVWAQTRDPRFYSREGVNDYQWPNPGDPDYR